MTTATRTRTTKDAAATGKSPGRRAPKSAATTESAMDARTDEAATATDAPTATEATPQPVDAQASEGGEQASETSSGKVDRYADESTASAIGKRLTDAKGAGFTRPALMELAGMTASAIWRAQNGKIHATEIERLTTALDRIASGEATPPKRATIGRASKNAQVATTLEAALQEKTLAGARTLITEALRLLTSRGA